MKKMQTRPANSLYDPIRANFYIKNFYIHFSKYEQFQNLTEEKINEIENFIQYWQEGITFKNCDNLAEKYYKTLFYLQNYISAPFDEKAYFLIKALDPELEILETYIISNTKEELKNNLLKAFGFVALHMIKIEKDYQKRFLPQKDLNFARILEKRESTQN